MTDLNDKTTTYGYDSGGHLATITDPLQHTLVTNTYDAQGRVIKQVDATNATTTFAYTGDETDTHAPDGGIWSDFHVGNVLTTSLDPYGNRTSYAYDSIGDPAGSLDPAGNQATAAFTNTGLLASTTDALGHSTTYTYDGNGTPATVQDADLNKTSFTFTGNLPTKVTDALNNSTVIGYTSSGQLQSVTEPRLGKVRYVYNPDGSVNTITDADNGVTSFTYDTHGNVATVTDPRGNVTGANPALYTTTYTHDNAGHVLTKTDPLHHETQYQYNDAGHLFKMIDPTQAVTQYVYDALGRLSQVIDNANHSTWYGYDSVGRLTSVKDDLGDITSYTYDDDGHRLSMTTPRGNVTGANKATYTTTYDYYPNGLLKDTYDPLGDKSTTVYDTDGRVHQQIDPMGNSTYYSYDNAGNLQSVTSPTNAYKTYSYNADNQLSSVEQFDSAYVAQGTTFYGYDADGNQTSVKTPTGDITSYTFDLAGRLATSVDPRGNAPGANPAAYTTTYSYDTAGNLTLVTDPLNHKTRTDYDADNQVTDTIDGDLNKTAYQYDADGRVSTVTDPLNLTTGYSYDTVGNLISRVDANNHTTSYTPNEIGQVVKVTDPLNRVTKYQYDADGNQYSKTDARNITTTTTFDALDRVSGITYSDGTASVGRTYDADGHLRTLTDTTGTRTFSYDPLGDLQSVTGGGLAGNGFSYYYNSLGEMLQRTHPDNEATSYTYDADLRVATATADGATITYGYDPAGNLHTTTLPSSNGYTETHTYDTADQLSSIASTNTAGILAAWILTRDNAGQPTKVAVTRAGQNPSTLNYGYDGDGRLTSAACTTPSATAGCPAGSTTLGYTYDSVGNRLTTSTNGATAASYNYDAADELTKSVAGTSTTSFGYDAAGDMTSAGPNTFTYDGAGRMHTATAAGTTHTYTYDGLGDRILASTPITKQATIWDINNPLPQIATETNNTGALIADYHYDPSGQIQSEHTTADTYYDHHDPLGSVTDLTSSTGVDQYRYSYDAYGNTTQTALTSSPPANPFQYTGQYKDPSTGATGDYLRARYYDPTTGRFNSPDPITLRPGTAYSSTYAYAEDAPTDRTDPSGQCSWIPFSGNLGCLQTLGLAGATANSTSPLGVVDTLVTSCAQGWQWGEQNYNNVNGDAGAYGCIGQFDGLNNIVQGGKDATHGCPNGQQELGLGVAQLGGLAFPGLDGAGGALDTLTPGETIGEGTAGLQGGGSSAGGEQDVFPVTTTAPVETLGAVNFSEPTADPIALKLAQYTDQAISEYQAGIISLSPSQATDAAADPSALNRYVGALLDERVKNLVLRDPSVSQLIEAPNGYYGPDWVVTSPSFRSPSGAPRWYDLTTRAEWQDHVNKYTPTLGRGIGLFWN